MARRGYGGLNKLRKTFKRMEPEARAGVTQELKHAGREIKKDAIALALMHDIRDTGEMIRHIDYKLNRDGSTVVVGPGARVVAGIKNPWDNSSIGALKMSISRKQEKMQFFKGYWAEVRPPYGRAEREFMKPAYEMNEPKIGPRIKRAMAIAIGKAARG